MLELFFKFLHYYEPQPIFLRLGFLSIYWYGVLIVLGIILGLFLTACLAKKISIKKELIQDLFIYLIIGGLIGARIYHVLSRIGYYSENVSEIFMPWRGGLGIFGGVVVGVIILFFYSRRKNINFFVLADLLSPALVLGQTIGRWGNYFNQEVFGKPTDLPWGIPINSLSRPIEFASSQYFHPTFFYESIWNLVVFCLLLLIFKKIYFFKASKFRKENVENNTKRRLRYSGIVFGCYLICYSFGRFWLEFLRIDPQAVLGGLRLGQLISIVFCLIGLLVIFRRNILKIKDHAVENF